MSEAKDLIKALIEAEREVITLDAKLDQIAEALDVSLYDQFRETKAAYREASERVSELRRIKRKMELGY